MIAEPSSNVDSKDFNAIQNEAQFETSGFDESHLIKDRLDWDDPGKRLSV